jgi:hypothetical protein
MLNVSTPSHTHVWVWFESLQCFNVSSFSIPVNSTAQSFCRKTNGYFAHRPQVQFSWFIGPIEQNTSFSLAVRSTDENYMPVQEFFRFLDSPKYVASNCLLVPFKLLLPKQSLESCSFWLPFLIGFFMLPCQKIRNLGGGS